MMKQGIVLILAVVLLCGCGLRSEPKKQAQQSTKQVQQEDDFLKIALNLIKQGNALAGIQALDQAIKQDSDNIQAYILLGQTYLHMNNFDSAVDAFRAALRVDPNQGEIYYTLAIVNGLRGRKDLAVTNAEKALLLFQKDQDGDNFKRALVLLQGLSQE